MRLSTKSRYGTRAMVEIARSYPGSQATRRDIAERQQIPDSYLENILASLREAGLIITSRGAGGGCRLARHPGKITVLDIVAALDGPVMPVPCIGEAGVCSRKLGCTTRHIWKELHTAMEAVLARHTLEHLLQQERQGCMDFVI